MISSQTSIFDTLVELDSDIVLTLDETFIDKWVAADVWGLDIETYGVNQSDEALNPFLGKVRLVQVALETEEIGVFDLNKNQMVVDVLQSKFQDGSITVIHNAAFELQWLSHKYGIVADKVFDTMIASQILYAGVEPYRHNLKAVILRELGIELNKDEQLSDFGLAELTNAQINYAGNDVRYLIRAAVVLMEKLKRAGLRDTIEIELAALLPYADMGLRGFPICEATLDDVLQQYQQALKTVSQPVLDKLGVQSVANSDALKAALGRYLNVTITGSNKTELSQYAHDPIVQALLDSRTLENFVGYLERCKAAVIDGSVRGNFRQCAPKGLGRATCGSDGKGIPGVNLHNPPNPSKASPTIKALGLPAVRSFFKPHAGQSLLIFDFSAAHARVAAQVTQDKAFIASYNDNVDCHAIVASKLSKLVGKNWSREDISRIRKQADEDGQLATRLRNISKNLFYGWLNGAGVKKEMETIHAGGLANATFEDAQEIIDLLKKSFPGIAKFHDRIKSEIKQTIALPSAPLKYAAIRAISGRRCFAPAYNSKGEGDRGGCNPNEAYIANWMMVESDAKKRAMGLIWKKSRKCPEWGMRLANECHDEIDVLCNTDYVESVAQFCWKAVNGSLGFWVKSIPAYESEYCLKDCLADSWASK